MNSMRRTLSLATTRMASRGMSTEIPIGAVARIVRMHVGDEATAIKADEIVNKIKTDLEAAKLPGYVKVCLEHPRMYCSSTLVGSRHHILSSSLFLALV